MNQLGWLILATALLVGGAGAQEQAPAEAPAAGQPAREDVPFLDELPPASGKDEASAGQKADAEQATDEEETLPPLPPEQRSSAPTPQRFDPSEEVRADFPVSFPIDI